VAVEFTISPPVGHDGLFLICSMNHFRVKSAALSGREQMGEESSGERERAELEPRPSPWTEKDEAGGTPFDRDRPIPTMGQRDGVARGVLTSVGRFFAMLGAYLRGEYRTFPRYSLVAFLLVIFYVLNPLDLVPDVIPILGVIDDVAVLGLCLRLIKVDLDRFRKWREGSVSVLK